MLKRTRLSAMLLVTLLLLNPVLMAFGATSGTSGGTASVGNITPVINSLSFTDSGSTDKDGQQVNVDTEYWIELEVNDDNTIEDLTDLEFIIWGPSSTEGGSDSNVDHYTFTYTQATDAWEEVGPDSGGDTHLVSGSCVDPASQTGGTETFKLAFKLHKTAEEDAAQSWTAKVIVTDDASATDTDATTNFGINYFREVTIGDASHSWSGLSPGDSLVALTSPGDFDVDLTVTSNDSFDVQAKGDGALTSGGDTIALVNAQIHADNSGAAVGLTTSYVDILGLTAESAGESQSKAFGVWLTVPNPQPVGSYTYTLTIQIVQS